MKQRKMSQFQHYVDFNFYETQKYVFMFWPRIFDDIKDNLLPSMAKIDHVKAEQYIKAAFGKSVS